MREPQHELIGQPELLRKLVDQASAMQPATQQELSQRVAAVIAGRHDAVDFLYDGAMIAALRQEATKLHACGDVGAALAWGKAAYIANRRFAHAWLSFLDIALAANVFQQRDRLSEKPSARIPATIVQYWDETAPPHDVLALIREWQASPGYRHELFDDARARRFIADRFERTVLEIYEQAPHVACKSDIFRLLWLALEGGIYIDADERKTSDIGRVLPEEAGLVVCWSPGDPPCLNNHFIGVRPNHPMIWTWLRLAIHHLNSARARKLKLSAWILTGPGVVSFAMLDSFCRFGTEPFSDIILQTEASYWGVGHTDLDLAYKSDATRNWRLSL